MTKSIDGSVLLGFCFAKILKTTPCRQEDYLTGTDCVTFLRAVETLGNCWWPGLNLNVFIRFRLEPISSFREMGKGCLVKLQFFECETLSPIKSGELNFAIVSSFQRFMNIIFVEQR